MAMGFRAPLCAAARQGEEAGVRVGEFGLGQSEPVTEAALRRAGGYRCCRRGTYCTRRIDAGRGLARAGRWSGSCAERLGRLARESAWRCLDADVTSKTHVELEVRRIYEPSRLAAVYVSAAYAQVVPPRQRPARWTSALASVSRVVAVRPEMGEAGARRAG
jgi:hypothetical protein